MTTATDRRPAWRANEEKDDEPALKGSPWAFSPAVHRQASHASKLSVVIHTRWICTDAHNVINNKPSLAHHRRHILVYIEFAEDAVFSQVCKATHMLVAAAHWILFQVSVDNIFPGSLCRPAFVLKGQAPKNKNEKRAWWNKREQYYTQHMILLYKYCCPALKARGAREWKPAIEKNIQDQAGHTIRVSILHTILLLKIAGICLEFPKHYTAGLYDSASGKFAWRAYVTGHQKPSKTASGESTHTHYTKYS